MYFNDSDERIIFEFMMKHRKGGGAAIDFGSSSVIYISIPALPTWFVRVNDVG